MHFVKVDQMVGLMNYQIILILASNCQNVLIIGAVGQDISSFHANQLMHYLGKEACVNLKRLLY